MLEIEQLRIDSFYIILSFYQILLSSRILVFYCIEYIYIYILLYFIRKLERSPRWRSFHVEKYQRSRIIITRKKRVHRVQSPDIIPNGEPWFFSRVFCSCSFFHIFRRLPLTSTCVYRDEKEPRMLCTMRKINRENTLWWLVRRKGNLGQEFFDVPPHWRSEWIARVQRPPPVEFTDQVFRFSARKGEFLEFFHHSIARTELLLMELLFYKRFFVEYCRFACGRRPFSSFLSFDRLRHFCSLEMEEEGTNPFFDSFFFFFRKIV